MNIIIKKRELVQTLETLVHEIETKLEKTECPLISAILMQKYEEAMKQINALNAEMCEIACNL